MAGSRFREIINWIETATARSKIQFPLAYYWFCALIISGLRTRQSSGF
jgi:hypothetical protein